MKSAAVVLALTAYAAAASASASPLPTGMRRADVPYSLPPAIARQTREMRETQQWQPLMHSAENAAKQQAQAQAEARVGDDPADSWMAYTLSKGNGQLLTLVNATWKVPSNPNEMDSGNAPGWWYGIEPAPASDLIQPILAWGYPDPSYTIFNGYFQWDNQNWWFSDQGSVLPGQTVVASVWYEAGNSSYTMFIGCVETGWGVYSSIPIEAGKLYTDTYFVMEHQPDDCAQLPASGKITFTDIIIQLNNKPVTAQWSAQQYQPACNSNAQVISPSSVAFTWDTSASAAAAKPDDA